MTNPTTFEQVLMQCAATPELVAKEVQIWQLLGYMSYDFDGARWWIEFLPPPWLDSDSAVINDKFFDDDYQRLKDFRIKLDAHRKLPRTTGWTWDDQRHGYRLIAEKVTPEVEQAP